MVESLSLPPLSLPGEIKSPLDLLVPLTNGQPFQVNAPDLLIGPLVTPWASDHKLSDQHDHFGPARPVPRRLSCL